MVAAAIIGAGVIGAVGSSVAANKGASAQESAAQDASNTQLQMFGQIQQNEAPYVQTGTQATDALAQFYGLPGSSGGAGGTPNYSQILQNLPGYQFQMQQGSQAVDRNLAAQGLLQSGAAGKALQTYGQGLAQNYAGQYTAGLSGLAQLGQAGAAGVASAGMNTANQIGSNDIYSGNAAAAGDANTANAINGGLSGIYSGLAYNSSTYAQPTPGYTNVNGATNYSADEQNAYLNSGQSYTGP